MRSGITDRSTASNDLMFAHNERHEFGVSPSILPDIANRDLRHPNPIRLFFADPTDPMRAPTRMGSRSVEAEGGPSSFPAAWQRCVAVRDQRIVVVEDRDDG